MKVRVLRGASWQHQSRGTVREAVWGGKPKAVLQHRSQVKPRAWAGRVPVRRHPPCKTGQPRGRARKRRCLPLAALLHALLTPDSINGLARLGDFAGISGMAPAGRRANTPRRMRSHAILLPAINIPK